jgi:pantoate--beta-alanine ligase
MGYLHKGHLSLVRESLRQTDCTVVSIYVNPKQFGPDEDYGRYPRDLAKDTAVLKEEGVDFVFACQDREMYPEDFKTYVEVHDLQDVLCGESRPGHFRGVCTVVLKLLHIVKPDIAFFGQKDAQQAVILKKMVKDLNMDVEISIHPIIREKDGLALSSRNTLLNPGERDAASCLFQSLQKARKTILNGETDSKKIINLIKNRIQKEKKTEVDYIEIVDKDSLESLPEIIKGKTLIACAVFIGKVRLIDNIII